MFGKAQQNDRVGELDRLRQRIVELEAEIARGVRIDNVTGLLTAHAFRGKLAEEVARARRYQRPLCLSIVEVDDFAAIETVHGFKTSDALLAAIGTRLQEITRTHDAIGRTGPAEFGILMPETDALEAREGLARVLLEIENVGEGIVGGVSASMGVARLDRALSAAGMIANARSACEHAQRAGGGQTALATDLQDPGEVAARALQRDAIVVLSVALSERDHYTGDHSAAVIEMSAAIARYMGLRAAEIERIKSAALLHDIGKVAIPDFILHKPGPLTDEEWTLMRQHPLIGERILSVVPGMSGVARIVRHEHERWDGTGYPDGLTGEQIPLGSRIILAADAYHAMTSDRPYRAARSHQEAIDELTRCAGTQFDPSVTAALIGYLYGKRQGAALEPEESTDFAAVGLHAA
jgi:diguanylate cyclase (GGDEF)-like protein